MLRNYANKLDDCIPNKFGCYRLIYFLKPLVLMPISHSPSACSALGFCRRSSPTGGNRFVLGFGQLVAPRQSCLRSVVVCCANYCLCVTIVLENKFSHIVPQTQQSSIATTSLRSALGFCRRSSPTGTYLIICHDVAQATVVWQSFFCASKGTRSVGGVSGDLSACGCCLLSQIPVLV